MFKNTPQHIFQYFGNKEILKTFREKNAHTQRHRSRTALGLSVAPHAPKDDREMLSKF